MDRRLRSSVAELGRGSKGKVADEWLARALDWQQSIGDGRRGVTSTAVALAASAGVARQGRWLGMAAQESNGSAAG